MAVADQQQGFGGVCGARGRTDEELSRLGGAGVEALFVRHHAALYRFCLGFVRQSDEAADVMQSVWERALVTLTQSAGTVAAVRPWLYAVARNECLDALRARGAVQTLDVSDLELAGGVSPEESYAQRAELALLVDDLAELSERQRSALVLRELAGFKGQQLASALGTSPPRASGLVAEARRGLIERRSGRGMPCSSAQHELTRMRRRSAGVQAHLDSCADCQSFERGRRGRSLSSLAISPLLFVGGLAERLSSLAPGGSPGIMVKASAATALAAGSIGFMQPAAPAVRQAPQHAARTAGAEHRHAVPAQRATPAAPVAARAVTAGARRVARAPARPQAHIDARPPAPAPATPPPATPPPATPRTPPEAARADVAPSTTRDEPPAPLTDLTARIDATVNTTRTTAQQLRSALHNTLTLLRK